MGHSNSKSVSEQQAEVYLTQQFSGNCDITCQNTINNVVIDVINSTVGGSIILKQACATNASCMIGSSSDAVADVLFKARNSSNARNAWSAWSLDPFNSDTADSESRQNIMESINQATNETCKISSYNQMDNITIFVADSTIGGNIELSQNASTQGQCKMTNAMTAAAYATGIAQNTAQSGKNKKGEKLGTKSRIMRMITFGIIAIAVLISVIVVAKIITGSSARSKRDQQMQDLVEARILAGCPGGKKPIVNPTTGRVVVDPMTGRPICPASSVTQKVAPQIIAPQRTSPEVVIQEIFPSGTSAPKIKTVAPKIKLPKGVTPKTAVKNYTTNVSKMVKQGVISPK